MTPTVEATRARADREERVYGQKDLAAMLRAGADAREECERLRGAADGDLNARLRANGMLTVEEQMQPFSKFQIHAGMTDLAFFGRWLEMKAREYSIMRARYEVGDKDKSDDLYEWVLAHSGAYHDVLVNFRAALGEPHDR